MCYILCDLNEKQQKEWNIISKSTYIDLFIKVMGLKKKSLMVKIQYLMK